MTGPIPFALTDIGLVRAVNQDAAFAAAHDQVAVAAVADGMGGLPFGERASALAIAAAEAVPESSADLAAHLRAVFRHARDALGAAADAEPALAGMGTTLLVAAVRGAEAYVAHLGDSRAYLWRGGWLEALTADHNAAHEAVERGQLTAEEALNHPGRHLLTRALTAHDEADPDVTGPVDCAGGTLLLVSDGISGVLTHAEIAAVLAEHRGARVALALRSRALERGAPDNLAVALLEWRPCD